MIQDLFLTKPIECKRPTFVNFDKDGFDLTMFETVCYETSGYPVENVAGRLVCRQNWITSVPVYDVKIDHAYICTRFGFKGDLADQIDELAFHHKMPELRKLLQVRPKMGIDINLEYEYENGKVLDLFHYEEDFVEGDPRPRIEFLENLIDETEWEDVAHELVETRDQWTHLTGDDENDYKARLIGLDRAYRTYKVL